MCRLVRDRAGTDRVCTHNDNNPRWLTLSYTQGTIRSVEGLRGERERGRAEPSASPRGGSEDFTTQVGVKSTNHRSHFFSESIFVT